MGGRDRPRHHPIRRLGRLSKGQAMNRFRSYLSSTLLAGLGAALVLTAGATGCNKGTGASGDGLTIGFIDECKYLSGIVAAQESKSKKLGFVAAKPIPQVLRNINAFTLGARSVDPKITCQVIFTGDWSLPVKEAEATNNLIDQGVDVV